MDKLSITSGLSAYIGSWGFFEAKHLLSRALYGAKKTEIDSVVALGLNNAVDQMLDASEVAPSVPLVNISHDSNAETAAHGTTWINEVNADNGNRRDSLYAWMMGEAIEQNMTFREKMVLFFFNHMPVQNTVYSATGLYRYHNIFRDNYLGNLKDIVKQVTVSNVMVRFLDGNDNKASAPNENFARELLELFTIGKGPQKGDGDYTNYTEDDVKATARVMTGWKVDWEKNNATFNEKHHDKGEKVFSAAFANAKITDQGDKEYESLINMLFQQKEVARFFCRKLYRFYVHYYIDDTIEKNIIEPLATILFDGGYDLKPVYQKLFKSQHFFDSGIIGGLIQSPIEYINALYRTFELNIPTKAEVDKRFYTLKYEGSNLCNGLGQELGNPPSVAGWAAYYSAPLFHRKWIDSVRFPLRQNNALSLVKGISKTRNTIAYSLALNYTAINVWLSDFADASKTVVDISQMIFPKALPTATINSLVTDYNAFLQLNSASTAEEKINYLITAFMIMPEFQLS